MMDPNDIQYLNCDLNCEIMRDVFWNSMITQVRTRYADGKVSKNYSITKTFGIPNFIKDQIILPQIFFNQFMGLLLAHNSDDWWSAETNLLTVPTANDVSMLPALEFLFGDYWVQIRPEDYMIE